MSTRGRLGLLLPLVATLLFCADGERRAQEPQKSATATSTETAEFPHEEVLEVVFRRLFKVSGLEAKKTATVFFIAVGDGPIPDTASVALVGRFAEHVPPVRALDRAAIRPDWGQIVDPKTKKQAVAFYARIYWQPGWNRCFVVAGAYAHGLSAETYLMSLRKVGGEWRLVDVGRTSVS